MRFILPQLLLPLAILFSQNSFSAPFAPTSIWNRAIPSSAVYADVSNALWGFSPQDSPAQFYLELITTIYTDPQSPPVNVRLSKSWSYPNRAIASSGTLYQRNIPSAEDVQESYDGRYGNSIVILIDPNTGAADEGGPAWRGTDGGDLLIHQDRPDLHYNYYTGSGLYNGVRGSGISGLGGAIQAGEINSVIPHALALLTSGRLYYKGCSYVWPASRCDSIATNPTYGYKGPNSAYTLGALLAIPPSVNVSALQFNTKQGYAVALAAQKYGMYLVDSTAAYGNRFALSMEFHAAATDIGLVVNPSNAYQSLDPNKLNGNAFQADMLSILHLAKAVISNRP